MQSPLPPQWSQAQFDWLCALGRATSRAGRQSLLAQHPEWRRAEVVLALLGGLRPSTPNEARAWLDAGRGLILVADTLNQPRPQGLTRLQVAYLHYLLDDLGRALSMIRDASRYFQRANDRLGLARAWHLQAEVVILTEGAKSALPLYQRARAVYAELRATDALLRCDYGLVRVYHLLGDDEKALQTARRAYQLAVQQGNRPMQARCHMSEGIVLRAMGRYDEALRAYQQSLDLWRKEGVELEQARVIANIGLVYWSMGLLTEAKMHYAEAMPIFHTSGSIADVATCQLNTALILTVEGDYLPALEHLREAQQQFEQVGDADGLSYCLLTRAEALEGLGRLMDALPIIHQACEMFQRIGNPAQLAYARMVKARLLIGLQRYEEARRVLQQAQPLLEQSQREAYPALYHFLMGEVARFARLPKEAERHYEETIRQLGAVPVLAGVPKEEMSQLLAKFHAQVSQIAWFFIGRGEHEKAFRALQAGKGVALRSSLGAQRSGGTDMTTQERRRLAQLQRDWEEAQRHKATTKAQQEAIRRYNEWMRYRRQLAQRRPRWAASQSVPLNPSELPLDNRTALIEYAFAIDGIGMLVVRRRGNRVVMSGATVRVPQERVLSTISELRRAIEGMGRTERIDALAHQLYDWLIRPIEPALNGVQHVVFCPDGGLHSIPWAVLKGRDNRYLIERYTLCTASSATVWGYAKRVASKTPPASERPLMVALWEFPRSASAGTRANLSQLPGVRTERALFQRLFGRVARIVSGEQAVPERVLNAFGKATLIHIATHAVPNFRLPLLSAIALYGAQEPRWLYAEDILQTRLSARLTVLSACSTAQGALGSDGMMGLAWAFMLAGCPSVLTTLWKLPDEGVPLWMETFYKAYLQGETVAQSVRTATLRLLRDPRYRHPRYWSAWLVQGAN